jgi:hypothetical protein
MVDGANPEAFKRTKKLGVATIGGFARRSPVLVSA